MVSHIKLFLFCLCVWPLSFCFAANKTLYYEPEIVELTGVIKLITYPGPPNYEDIKKGDMEETCPYLTLDYPINTRVLPNNADPTLENENNVKVTQLSVDSEKYWKMIEMGIKKRKHFRVTGTLFHWFTGHHHTKVLMLVERVKLY